MTQQLSSISFVTLVYFGTKRNSSHSNRCLKEVGLTLNQRIFISNKLLNDPFGGVLSCKLHQRISSILIALAENS